MANIIVIVVIVLADFFIVVKIKKHAFRGQMMEFILKIVLSKS
jgi:hypothetical protein